MGRPYLLKLEGKIYKCRFCESHLTSSDELLSKMWAFRASATTGTDSTLGTYVVMPLANQIYRPYECELLRGFHCRQGTAYLFKVVHSVVETHNYGDIHESDDDWLPAESSKRGKSMSRNQKLFEISVNILVGPKEDRLMTTGLHTVSDIFCICCNQIVGWKYDKAYEFSQKYKEGKFILELAKTSSGSGDISELFLESNPMSSDTEAA